MNKIEKYRTWLQTKSDEEVVYIFNAVSRGKKPDAFGCIKDEMERRNISADSERKYNFDTYSKDRAFLTPVVILITLGVLAGSYFLLPVPFRTFPYISIIISFIIGIFAIGKIRSYDLFEKEEILKLINATLYGGALAIILALIAYMFLHSVGITGYFSWWGSFLVIAPIEEFVKVIAFVIIYGLFHDDFNEPTDGILYMASVALGFSLIENYWYANMGAQSGTLLITRTLICTPAHISFSFLNGLAYYLVEKENYPKSILVKSFLLSVLCHGIYDASVFLNIPLLNIFFVILMYRWLISVLNYTNVASPYRIGIHEWISETAATEAHWKDCEHCDKRGVMATYRKKQFSFSKCPHCGVYNISRDDLFRLFHYFAPRFERLDSHYTESGQHPGSFCLFKGNFINNKRKKGYFWLDEIAEIFDEINTRTIEMETKRFIYKLLFGKKVFSPARKYVTSKYMPLPRACIIAIVGVVLNGIIMLMAASQSDRAAFTKTSASKTIDNRYFSFDYPDNWEIDNYTESPGVPLSLRLHHNKYYWLTFKAYENQSDVIGAVDIHKVRKRNQEVIRIDTIRTWGQMAGEGYDVLCSAPGGRQLKYTFFCIQENRRFLYIEECYPKRFSDAVQKGRNLIRSSFIWKKVMVLDTLGVSPDSILEKTL